MSRSDKRRAEVSIAFRLDPKVAAIVAEKAARHGLSTGQYARALVMTDTGHSLPVLRRGPPHDAVELRRLVAHLGKVGSNLNQLARVANIPGLGIDHDALGRALADLAGIRSALLVALRVREP